MKKILYINLIFVLLFCTVSCKGNKKYTPIYNTFFEEEVLSINNLENLPKINNLDSLMYKEANNTLYLNLTKDEFNNYVNELYNYIINKENIYNVGLFYNNRTYVGPMFLPCNVEVFIPLVDSMEDNLLSYKFSFSTVEELNSGWISNQMHNCFSVMISYEDGYLDDVKYSYNTLLVVEEVNYASFDTCAKQHYYENEVVLVVPTTIYKVAYSYCKYCGKENQNYHYGDYQTLYNVNIIEGLNYLDISSKEAYNNFPKCYVGLPYYIKIPYSENISYQVFVNDCEISLTHIKDNCFVYGFVMPYFDVNIKIIKVIE